MSRLFLVQVLKYTVNICENVPLFVMTVINFVAGTSVTQRAVYTQHSPGAGILSSLSSAGEFELHND
jgi:hypothetical protein